MVTGKRIFTFAVIADTHITEAEAMAISGFDIDTIKLGAARSRYVVGRLNSLQPDFVVHLGDLFALERDLGEVLHVEEIVRAQVAVAFFVLGRDAG